MDLEQSLQHEIALIGRLPAVPTILEVICRTTKMGFAAVARVTDDRWIACSVQDDIGFGLRPGGELEIKTTLCDEIRANGQLIVFDNAAEDPRYCDHHTPRTYGLQSYISVPVFLNTGEFFGTLCAIDPRPAKVNNSETIAMFQLFASLIAIQFQMLQASEMTKDELQQTSRQLAGYKEEIGQFSRLTNHSLQEPLRKIRLFADILVDAHGAGNMEKVTTTAHKIRQFAADMARMVQDVNEYSLTDSVAPRMETVDLNEVVQTVLGRMKVKLAERGAKIDTDVLHTIKGIPTQVNRLFYNLIDNAVKYVRKGVPPHIRLYSKDCRPEEIEKEPLLNQRLQYCEISIADNGAGLHPSEIAHLFDIANKTDPQGVPAGLSSGLAEVRRIVYHHQGIIRVRSIPDEGSVFSIFLPIEQ